jgi:hypothetical protein
MRPVAGLTIKFLSVVDMRGMSNPFVVELISSIEVAAGDPGVPLINTWPEIPASRPNKQRTSKCTQVKYFMLCHLK